MAMRILRQGVNWQAGLLDHFSHMIRPRYAVIPHGFQIDYAATREWVDKQIVDLFHATARQHNSQAEWLPGSGVVVTPDDAEPVMGFPYERWLQQAIKAVTARLFANDLDLVVVPLPQETAAVA